MQSPHHHQVSIWFAHRIKMYSGYLTPSTLTCGGAAMKLRTSFGVTAAPIYCSYSYVWLSYLVICRNKFREYQIEYFAADISRVFGIPRYPVLNKPCKFSSGKVVLIFRRDKDIRNVKRLSETELCSQRKKITNPRIAFRR